jgi:hypothetical protein
MTLTIQTTLERARALLKFLNKEWIKIGNPEEDRLIKDCINDIKEQVEDMEKWLKK